MLWMLGVVWAGAESALGDGFDDGVVVEREDGGEGENESENEGGSENEDEDEDEGEGESGDEGESESENESENECENENEDEDEDEDEDENENESDTDTEDKPVPAHNPLPAHPHPIASSANPSPTIDLSFPAALAARGHTREAWLEYERLAHSLPPGAAADRARFLAGELLLAEQRADLSAGLRPGPEAANHFAQAPVSADSAPLFRLMVVEAQYEARQYVLAETQLAALSPTAPLSLDPALRYREAWLRLRQGDPAAPDYFAAVPGEGPLAQAGDALSAELRALPPLPTRSPLAAGLLSAVLPGAGQLYAGEPRDAASALLLNGLFIGGTTALLRQRAWPAAALTGLFTLGFYSGNILSAVNVARRRNQRLERARLDTLAAEWELHVGLVPAEPGAPLEPELNLARP